MEHKVDQKQVFPHLNPWPPILRAPLTQHLRVRRHGGASTSPVQRGSVNNSHAEVGLELFKCYKCLNINLILKCNMDTSIFFAQLTKCNLRSNKCCIHIFVQRDNCFYLETGRMNNIHSPKIVVLAFSF